MIHEGVNLAPIYKHKGVIKYKNQVTKIHPIHEEYLVYWNRLKEEYKKDALIRANFKKCMKKYGKFEEEMLDDKQVIKESKRNQKNFEKAKQVSNIVSIDGVTQEIMNNVEQPGIFIGKGNHPLRGNIKLRIQPRDIIINISKNVKLEENYKRICSPNSNFIACWKDKLMDGKTKFKYINITPSSENKFIECHKRKYKIGRLKSKIEEDIKKGDRKKKECGVITYIIMKYNIRIGHEKDDEYTNDSVGCCTLLKENIELKENNYICLKFIGKSNILYKNTRKVNEHVYNYIKEKDKMKGNELFEVNASQVNEYLNKYVDGLTGKMFRTYNASTYCNKLLKECKTIKELRESIIKVAKLCNHQRNGKYEGTTCKNNYIDPRIIYSFCAKHNIDIDKIYNNMQKNIHKWAFVETNHNFNY